MARVMLRALGVSCSSQHTANLSTTRKIILVAVSIAAVAVAAPSEPPKILRSEFDQKPDGSYVYSFETEDGISRVENGEVKEALDEENKPHSVVVVRGSYSYTDSDGVLQTITYFADETGYHPEGDSIPKAASRR